MLSILSCCQLNYREWILNVDTESFGNNQDAQESRQTIQFGVEGNCEQFVTTGWSAPEGGFRWMVGGESELRLDRRFEGGDYIIELEVGPFVAPPLVSSQRLTVSVNGALIGQSTVTHGGRFGYRIPAAALAGVATTSVVLIHPDAARPCDCRPSDDTRLLSFSVKRLTVSRIFPGRSGLRIEGSGGIALSDLEQIVGMAPNKFMLCFESLGDNCEFGLVQRRCGAEPLSLLRFSSVQLPSLLRGLDVGFQDLANAADLEFRLEGKDRQEYIVREKRYDIDYHTFRYKGEVDEEKFISSEPARLAFLVREFVDDLRSGDKIFVCKRNKPLLEHEIVPLYAAINSYGQNFLLWLVPADAENTSGSVEIVMPGLLRGFIDRFAPGENAHDLLLDAWLEVCANAYRLSRMKA